MKQDLRIGRILVEMGKVAPEALDGAAAMKPDRPLRFASRLRALYGIEEDCLVEGLAQQKGLPGVVLSRSILDLSALGSIPRHVAEKSGFLPLSVEEGRLHVAFIDPDDHSLIDELTFVTGKDVMPYVVLQGSLVDLLGNAYEAAASGVRYWSPISGKADEVEIIRRLPPGVGDHGTSESPDEDEISLLVEIEEDPLVVVSEEVEAPVPSDHVNGARRVLIVDDEPEILHLLGTAIGKAGYQIETAERGLEALEKIRSFEPELVVLDAMLPEVHGFEICRKIRSSQKFKEVPVIMISAVYRGWRIAQDLKDVYGVTDFIEKPFRIVDVLSRVEAALVGAKPAPKTSAEARKAASRAYRDGLSLLKARDFEKAADTFRAGLESDPFLVTLHLGLGRALHLKGEVYGAMTAYERAVELEASLFPALKGLALIYESKGFLRKAIESWEQVLLSAPDESGRQMAQQRLLSLIEKGRAAREPVDELE